LNFSGRPVDLSLRSHRLAIDKTTQMSTDYAYAEHTYRSQHSNGRDRHQWRCNVPNLRAESAQDVRPDRTIAGGGSIDGI
jgi:hypothetical protein